LMTYQRNIGSLLQQDAVDDGAQRAGQTVLGEAERLDRLIADLLVLARLEAADLPVEVVDVDLTQLVAATALALEISASAAMATAGSENFFRAHFERGGMR